MGSNVRHKKDGVILRSNFGFYQLLRLAEQQNLSVEFRTATDQAFPEFDLTIIKQSSTQLILEHNLFSLIGKNAILPDHYSEYFLKCINAKDYSLQQFLEIFNAVLIRQYYTAWRESEFFVAYETQSNKNFIIDCLFTFMGLPKSLINTPFNEVFLYHAGIMANPIRSKQGLQVLLSNYFSIEIRIEEFCGQWLKILLEEQSSLSNNQLGVNTVIGARFWDIISSFKIIIGPMKYEDYLQWLPNQPSLRAIHQLVKYYCGMNLCFSIEFEIDYHTLPYCQLYSLAQLGWNTWLKSSQKLEENVTIEFRRTSNISGF